ncbi:hypothetical protein [Amycolatopsis tucumanensis]|uniref:hypothetical protein n=1 Tax=Amycolatopsis tucumanensis TaxID=401106 RepID=UPI003D73DBCA
MDSSRVQSPSKQSRTFELGGAGGFGFALVVAGSADVEVVGGMVVAGAVVGGAGVVDGGGCCATGAAVPQPARTRDSAVRAKTCLRMVHW